MSVARPRKASSKQPIEFAPNDSVAFARGFLETFAIQDRDLSAPITDQPCALQSARDDRHTGTPGTEHLGKELVRDIEFITFHPIVRHKEPATTTLLDGVPPIAGGQLRQLREQGQRVAMQKLAAAKVSRHEV
jgi:hypothetical protein